MRSTVVVALFCGLLAPLSTAGGGRHAPRPDTTPLRPAPTPHDDDSTMGLVATDFGAVGDNTTDDTAALQAAVDAAQGLGRQLFVPAGRYITCYQIPATAVHEPAAAD